MLRLSFLLGWVLAAVIPPAPAVRPPAGVTVDQTRTVDLPAAPPRPCIAVAFQDVTVLLDKAAVERLAAGVSARGTTEREREAFVAAAQAQALLSQLSTAAARTESGCFAVAGPLSADAEYAVLSTLEAGAASVKDRASGQMAAAVRIRYLGERCGPLCGQGEILVYLPAARQPFLVLSWWRA